MNPRTDPRPRRTRLVGFLLLVLLPVSASADADDDFKLARNLFRDAGDYATAAQLLAAFIRNHPSAPQQADARLLLARSYARSQRCREAVPAFEDFYLGYSDHLEAPAARRERSDCLVRMGKFGTAATGYEDVQRLYSEAQYAAGSLLSAASSYARDGDLANAIRAYQKLLADYATKSEARRGRYRLAQLRFASGDAAGALALLASIAASGPGSEEARDGLLLAGNIHLVLNRPQAAATSFDGLHTAFKGSAQSDSAYLDLADYYLARKAYDDAISHYERALEGIEGDMAAQARLGHANALRLSGQVAESLAEYDELVRPGSSVLAQAQLGQAIALGKTDRFGAAVGLFLQLAQTPSGGPPSAVTAAAVRELGALYRRQGDLARANSWFRRYLDDSERFAGAFPESTVERDLVRLQLAQVRDASGYYDDAVRRFADLGRDPGPLAAEAQYGLAAAHEGADARRLAITEYGIFLERYPSHPRAAQVRQRIEYLREYTILDAAGLARALSQSYIDELSGTSRQRIRLNVARALRDHQDFANAVRAWETFVASYPGDGVTAEAQFYLADCLYRFSRQRQLEGDAEFADSLHALALQEDRILADADAGRWSRLARLRLVESMAATESDTARTRVLEQGYSAFLQQHPLTEETTEARARALLGLGDARRMAALADSAKLKEADEAYRLLLVEAGQSTLARRARFGRAAVALQGGQNAAAIDSLATLLPVLTGTALQPQALALLAQALARADRHLEAATRLSELLLAFPDHDGRRNAQELLGDTYLALGDADRAVELLSSLAGADPQGDVDGSLRLRLAQAHRLRGDAATALNIYDRLLAQNTGPIDTLRLARGRMLARLGRIDEAVDAFGLVRSGPLLSAARIGAADLHFASGQFEQASAAYTPLLADTEDTTIVGRAVVSLYELGRRQEADELADRHRKEFGKYGIWPYLFRLYEGRYWLARREYDKAHDAFDGVAEDAAKNPVSIDMGDGVPIVMRRMAQDPLSAGSFFAATSEWEKMRAEPTEEGTSQALQSQSNFASRFPDSPFSADIYMRLAEFQLAIENLLPAAGAFRRVVDGKHGTAEQRQIAVWQLLQCYSKLSRWDEAMRIARRIQSEFPDHPRVTAVQLEIGYILMNMGQHAQAITALQNVLEWAEGEDAAEARYYIGQAYQNMAEYRKAITAFYEVGFYGADASTQWINTADFQRAQCNEVLGEFEQARRIYNIIIRREGGASEWGGLARQKIESLPPPPPSGN